MQVWDFTSFSGVNDEPVVIANDSRIQWYTDASHFNRNLGDQLLNRIFGRPTSNEFISMAGFGKRLTPQNVESHLAHQTNQFARSRTQLAGRGQPNNN
jgi:hypothetical protein